jgi:hypothetical protein
MCEVMGSVPREMGDKKHKETDGNDISLLLFLKNKDCRLKGDT